MLESDLLRVVGVCVTLLGLGLVMGLSPTLYAVELRTLTRGSRPLPSIGGLVAGLATGATVLAALFQVVDPDSLQALLQGQVERALLERGVDLAAGAAFVVAGGWLAVRSRRARRERSAEPAPGAERPGRLFVVGLASAVVSLSSLPTMYVTARTVHGVSDDDPLRLAAYAVFLLALVGPYLLVAWAWERLPGLAAAARRGQAWLGERDLRRPAAAALVVVGVGFVVARIRAG